MAIPVNTQTNEIGAIRLLFHYDFSTGTEGHVFSQSISMKDMEQVIFSVERVIVHALPRREAVFYFAKPPWLCHKNALAFCQSVKISLEVLSRRHWQRSR